MDRTKPLTEACDMLEAGKTVWVLDGWAHDIKYMATKRGINVRMDWVSSQWRMEAV